MICSRGAVLIDLISDVRMHVRGTSGTHLVGLRHIGKDAVDHGDQHAVLVRVPRVLDDGNDVGSLFCLRCPKQ